MTRLAVVLTLLLATGCQRPPPTCGVGGIIGPLMSKALFEGAFVHRIDSIETIDGTYAPPALAPETPAMLRFEEHSWVAVVGAARIELQILSHGELIEVMDRCASHAYVTDTETSWDGLPWAHVAAEEDLGRPTVSFDESIDAIEPSFFAYGYPLGESIENPLTHDTDRRGFVLAADYVVRPSGCAEATCSSTVRVRHHFRRSDAP